jgi:excisionase family DNA binding protein
MPLTFVKKAWTPTQVVAGTTGPLKLLSVKDAAAYAKVSTQTVRRLIKAGDLKTYRVGRQIRIDESDLIANITPQELKW